MPELPDLQVIQKVLNQKIQGLQIEEVQILQPIVIRYPSLEQFAQSLGGKAILQVSRRGKFLIFHLETDFQLVLHLMLVGRLQLCEPAVRLKSRTCLRLGLSNAAELRYFDPKLMGRVYLVEGNDFSVIPQFLSLGPEPLDDEFTLNVFHKRIRRHPGEIKNLLTNQSFLAGIGNAYADEILFAAGIFPFRRRPSLSPEEIERLYHSTKTVLSEAIQTISGRVGEQIDIELRDFLRVHRRGGQYCPVCGHKISEIKANRKITSFCRNCQR